MKSITLLSAAGVLLLAAVIHSQGVPAQRQSQGNNARIYRGEVSDSQCALNVHSLTRSHQEMLKSKSMGGTANTCSLYCIEHLGGDLVLVSGKDGKDVYHLDRADLVHGFEGQKVKITGVLDSQNTHLHVLKIELQPQP
jgi:putative hemolysin